MALMVRSPDPLPPTVEELLRRAPAFMIESDQALTPEGVDAMRKAIDARLGSPNWTMLRSMYDHDEVVMSLIDGYEESWKQLRGMPVTYTLTDGAMAEKPEIGAPLVHLGSFLFGALTLALTKIALDLAPLSAVVFCVGAITLVGLFLITHKVLHR